MYGMRKEIQQYRQAGRLSEVAVADPHRLIQMLYESVLERVAVARGAMANGNLKIKGEQISKTIAILQSLRAMLDHEKGGEVASNLDMLYEYMIRRIIEGNRNHDPEPLEEVIGLMRTVKSGWDEIPSQLRQAS